MKRLAMLLVLIAFATTGCGLTDANSSEDLEDDNLRPTEVVLRDGTVTQCVVFQSINEGGLWCSEPQKQAVP